MIRQSITSPKLDNIEPELRYGKMKKLVKYAGCASLFAMLMLPLTFAQAAVLVQCPGDTDGDAVINTPDPAHPNAVCMHLSGGDGAVNMADGYPLYIFSFGDLTGTPPEDAIDKGLLHAEHTAPNIVLDEGDEFYLTLTNTGMVFRPDLFDPHTVHFHGFPNASSIFDGVPDVSVSINMGASLTYYYNIVEPGTYMYHCHVEAAEHMQMGMLGNLYVHPAQDGTAFEYPAGSGRNYTQFAYNDGDGSTGYDIEMPIQITSFDPDFHDASFGVQPLPFANMNDRYHMFNGRGYPITVQNTDYYTDNPGKAQGVDNDGGPSNVTAWTEAQGDIGFNSQPNSSYVEVPQGQKLLLRVSNLNVTTFHTFSVLGLPMRVVGQGGRELVDKYDTTSVNLGGGESWDVVVDTQDVPQGTYFAYVTELHRLSNNQQSFGGPMTEIVVTAPATP
jgi:FtsP/CotA-like multicopper oxidase with cupredoxin domain